MKNRLSHIAPLLFLSFLLLPLVSLLLLQGAQYYLQSNANERIQHHQAVTISLPAADVVWLKKGREITIDGKLFDIKTYQFANGTFTATGFYDDAEICLVHLLSTLTSPEHSKVLLNFLLVLQCFSVPLLCYLFCRMGEKKITHRTAFFFLLPMPFCSIAEQPPQC